MTPLGRPHPSLLYLSRSDVEQACAHLDPVGTVREALLLHAAGRTTLPEEAYLPWDTSVGTFARSISLPGALWGERPALGVKTINSSLVNPSHGLPRAQGLITLFDHDTAYPTAVLEAAHISALRTAAYTVLSTRVLAAKGCERVAVIGCGALAAAHVRLLVAELGEKTAFHVYDLDPSQAQSLAATLRATGVDVRTAASARAAVTGAQLVVTTTVTTTGYLPFAWLDPGTLVAHVSLDDVLPDVVALSDLVVVDDWSLVSHDDRRLLGRMYRSGDLAGPDGELFEAEAEADGARARKVDATLADIVSGSRPGRRTPEQIILSNPFGMGILDVAVAAEVLHTATALGLGRTLPR
ncbi:ornithine cyclodeaminase family protein [Streptomyces olivaceoviridis]|uniref:ornithine cyclodeaminase family protein n=1 Tax=Streptomyces olivaceoviridis TaxID=1921 RepID=UPI0036F75BAC